MNPPVNNLGITEADWNKWRDQVAEWEAANPVRHEPWQDCRCPDFPTLVGRDQRYRGGHCAVREPIADWRPADRPRQ